MHSPLTRLMIMGDLPPVFVTCLPLLSCQTFLSMFSLGYMWCIGKFSFQCLTIMQSLGGSLLGNLLGLKVRTRVPFLKR